MTDAISGAPGAGEGDSTPVTVITPAADTPQKISAREAAQVLAAARAAKRQEAAQAAPAQAEASPETEQDAAPPQEAPGEETTETNEPPAEQLEPIEPPRSWTKEAKERWQSLPRETQEYLASREQERDREVRRSQNEAAEQRKSIEAERQKAEQARQEYEAKLPALMQALHDASPFADIKSMADVEKLQAEDPFRFQQFQVYQWKMQGVQGELQAAEQRKATETQTKWAEHINSENTRFAESLSDADRSKLQALTAEAPKFLEERGFTQEELTKLASGQDRLSIYDHRVQSLILDGMKYRDAQKAKTTKTATPVPQVQKPGAAPAKGAAALQNIQALETRLDNATGVNALRIAAQLAQQRRAATSR